MEIIQKECIHIIEVLDNTKIALKNKNAIKLKDLSNKTIHSACNYQDSASITIAVMLYTLSKLIERNDYYKVKNWDLFVKKFNAVLDLAIQAIQKEDQEMYESYVLKARSLLESHSINLKRY